MSGRGSSSSPSCLTTAIRSRLATGRSSTSGSAHNARPSTGVGPTATVATGTLAFRLSAPAPRPAPAALAAAAVDGQPPGAAGALGELGVADVVADRQQRVLDRDQAL